MSDTEQLIDRLARSASMGGPCSNPFALCFQWLLAVAFYVTCSAIFLELRPDIEIKLLSPLFLDEIVALILFITSTSLASALLSYPDNFQKPKLLWLPYFSAALFLLVVTLAWFTSPRAIPRPSNELECLTCITLLSFIPAITLFWHIRNMAPTQRGKAGAMAMLSAFGIGALTLRLCEETDSIAHLVQWHYAPMLAVNFIGIVLGKKILKW